jgi:HSP20 family protein
MDPLRTILTGNAFRDLENVADRLNQLFAGRNALRSDKEEAMAQIDWVPIVNVLESDSEFQIEAELPGVDKNDMKLSVEDGVLTISGQRAKEKEEKGRRYHRVERAYGTFTRSFTIPELVDEKRLTAEFKNGILIVHLPKSEKAQPKSIEVQIH